VADDSDDNSRGKVQNVVTDSSKEKIKWNCSAEGLTTLLPKTLPDPLEFAFKLEVK
jgi:hypothetical protein